MKARLHTVVPWQAKIAAKMLLSRLPVPMRAWHRLGLFVPGSMRDPDYAIRVFEIHWERTGRPAPGFTYLELGPGESLATAIVAWAFGASGGTLVDAGDFAMRDIASYRPLIERLARRTTSIRDVSGLLRLPSLESMLDAVNATVRTDDLRGLESLPSETVDLVFSQAVLEHVPLASFRALACALYRLQKRSGLGSHHVDFKDHLQGSLNNLRFSKAMWEKPWFAARSGFYTNRLRLSDMVEAFQAAGFSVAVPQRDTWPALPIPRAALAKPFRDMPEDQLRTWGAVLVLTKGPR
jgi:hypothetical protein